MPADARLRASSARQPSIDMARPIFLLTDFGPASHYVGIMKAVIARVAPSAPVHDLAHDVPSGDILGGRYVLEAACRYLPDDAVVVAVVDPGVGSARGVLCVHGSGHPTLIGPDNGLFAGFASDAATGPVFRAVGRRDLELPERSMTFHGRDVFAPLGAHVAGGVDEAGLGPVVAPEKLDRAAPEPGRAHIVFIDRFGNLITDLPAAALVVDRVEVAGRRVTRRGRTFADVASGELFHYVGSSGRLEIAVRDGDAARELGVKTGDAVVWIAGSGAPEQPDNQARD